MLTQTTSTEEVIDLTQTKAIDELVEALTEQLIVTETVQRDYFRAEYALATLAHRAPKLICRVFEPFATSRPHAELQSV